MWISREWCNGGWDPLINQQPSFAMLFSQNVMARREKITAELDFKICQLFLMKLLGIFKYILIKQAPFLNYQVCVLWSHHFTSWLSTCPMATCLIISESATEKKWPRSCCCTWPPRSLPQWSIWRRRISSIGMWSPITACYSPWSYLVWCANKECENIPGNFQMTQESSFLFDKACPL